MTVQLEISGQVAPPRSNGELVFEEPWHARAFGLAVRLVQHRGLEWDEFRRRLIEEIAEWESRRAGAPVDAYEYYERWLAALERLVVETGFVSADELRDEISHLERSDAHDHLHDH